MSYSWEMNFGNIKDNFNYEHSYYEYSLLFGPMLKLNNNFFTGIYVKGGYVDFDIEGSSTTNSILGLKGYIE